jgi:hypothetical protein
MSIIRVIVPFTEGQVLVCHDILVNVGAAKELVELYHTLLPDWSWKDMIKEVATDLAIPVETLIASPNMMTLIECKIKASIHSFIRFCVQKKYGARFGWKYVINNLPLTMSDFHFSFQYEGEKMPNT